MDEGQKKGMRDREEGEEKRKKGNKKEQEILQPHYQRFYDTFIIYIHAAIITNFKNSIFMIFRLYMLSKILSL